MPWLLWPQCSGSSHPFNQLGFKSKKEYISTIWVVGILVGLMFSGLYLGLAFLGNHFPLDTSTLGEGANLGAAVLSSATQAIFGPMSTDFPSSYGNSDLLYDNSRLDCGDR